MNKCHYLQLCYFHFSQSMVKHFPEKKVYEVINEHGRHELSKKFPKYLRDNYLKEYNFEDWGVYEKTSQDTITNNVAESHNNELKNTIDSKPSFQKFEIKIQKIEQE